MSKSDVKCVLIINCLCMLIHIYLLLMEKIYIVMKGAFIHWYKLGIKKHISGNVYVLFVLVFWGVCLLCFCVCVFECVGCLCMLNISA